MVEFDLPETFTEEFLALIPRQRYVINTMLAQGSIKSYSLAIDRSKLWAVMLGDSEFDVMENIAQMPLKAALQTADHGVGLAAHPQLQG